MRELEERCYTAASGEDVTGDKLDNAFVTRKDCREITRDIYSQVLKAQGLHLDKLEDRAETTISHFKFHAANMDDIRAKLKSLDEAVEDRKAEIAAAREQDKENHEAVMAVHHQHEEDTRHEHAYFEAVCDGLRKKAEEEERARLDLEAEHKKLYDLIHDKGLHETFRQICQEILADYISWDAFRAQADKIHQQAVREVTIPLSNDITKLGMRTTSLIQELRGQDAEIREAMQEVSDRVTVTDTKFTDKTNDIMDVMKDFAQYDVVKAMEDQLNERIQHNEKDFVEFKIATSETLDTHMNRLTDIRNMLDDHEHCLRHHAEEILNRSTKYDMVCLQQKVDQCAIKEKVEADLEALNKTVTWQSVRLEDVVFRSNFGEINHQQEDGRGSGLLSSEASEVAVDTGKVRASFTNTNASTHISGNSVSSRAESKAEAVSPEPGSPRGSTKNIKFGSEPGSPRSHRAGVPSSSGNLHQDSELFAVLQSQLESLAHCLLGMAHAAFRGPTLGCSREERLAREHELLYHISNLVHWVTHRRAPNDWDPTRLTSLALECMETDKAKRRSTRTSHSSERSTLGAGAGHSQSQELAMASTSSSSWSTSDFVSTESIGPSKGFRRGTRDKSPRRKTSPSRPTGSLQKAPLQSMVAKPGDVQPSGPPVQSKRMTLSPPTIVKASHRGTATGKVFTTGDAVAEGEVGNGDQHRKPGQLQAPAAVNRPSTVKPEHMRELVCDVAGGQEVLPKKMASGARGSTCAPPPGSSLLKRTGTGGKTPLSPIDAGGQENSDAEPELSMQTSSLPRLTARAAGATNSPSQGSDVAKGDSPSV